MTIDLYPTIAARIGDPGAYVPRKLTPAGEPMETVPRWAARAVVDAVQPVIDELTAELEKVRAELTLVTDQRDAARAMADELRDDLRAADDNNGFLQQHIADIRAEAAR